MSAAAKTAVPADKKPSAPKSPGLTMAQRFEVQQLVNAADTSTPDATLAAQAAEKIGRQVAPALIANYRKEFGLASVAKPTYAQLEARIVELEAHNADCERRLDALAPKVAS